MSARLEDRSLEKFFARFQKVSIIAVIASGLGSLLMFIMGAVKLARAYASYFSPVVETGHFSQSAASQSITYVVQAIDAFLIAMVLLVFSSGVFSLFVSSKPVTEMHSSRRFGISSLGELKRSLAELIVIVLMVKFLEEALVTADSFDWFTLVLPASILALAASVRVIRLQH